MVSLEFSIDIILLNLMETCGPEEGLLIYIYTGCPGRNVPEFGRVFLMLKYTDITQNTYIQI